MKPGDRSSPPFRFVGVIVFAAIIAALVAWFSVPWISRLIEREQKPTTASITPHKAAMPSAARPIGEAMLKNYASSAQTIQRDLDDVSHVLTNFVTLVKGDNPIPLGANEEVAKALLGKNRARLVFIAEDSKVLNAQHQLIDRWGTPLFFHANDHEHLDVRSAGPDREMWTADDVHRRFDGRFLKGEELTAPSLNDLLHQPAGKRR